MMRRRITLVVILVGFMIVAIGGMVAWQPWSQEAGLVGAGDIGNCKGGVDEQTAQLLEAIPGTIFTTGDNAYEQGTAQQFQDCYGRGHQRARSQL